MIGLDLLALGLDPVRADALFGPRATKITRFTCQHCGRVNERTDDAPEQDWRGWTYSEIVSRIKDHGMISVELMSPQQVVKEINLRPPRGGA